MKNTKFLFDETKHNLEGMVSVSQLQTFMSCPKKWEYNYVDKLSPRVERPYLGIGKLCHKGMEAAMRLYWEDGNKLNWTKDDALSVGIEAMEREFDEYMSNNCFLEEELPEQNQMYMDALSVFTQAFFEFDIEKYEVLTLYKNGKPIPAVELHFVVPCAGSKGLHGYIDCIVREKETGFVWCTDYKFRKTLSPDTEEALNIQNAVYSYACMKMGIDITGTMTWQHINTPAADPQILKNGSVSRAKIKTTWEHYMRFLVNNGINPSLYQEEMEPKLNENEFYRATYENRNIIFMKNIWKDVVVPASYRVKSAVKKQNKKHLYPWNCKMCQYQELCQGELRGYDVEFIKGSSYTVRNKQITDKDILDDTTEPVL